MSCVAGVHIIANISQEERWMGENSQIPALQRAIIEKDRVTDHTDHYWRSQQCTEYIRGSFRTTEDPTKKTGDLNTETRQAWKSPGEPANPRMKEQKIALSIK